MKYLVKIFFLVLAFNIHLVSNAQNINSRSYRLAEAYFSKKECQQAIKYYLRTSQKSANPALLEKLAHCYRFTNQNNKAEKYYASILEKKSPKDTLHYFYGLVLKKNGNYKQAKKEFDLLSENYPTNILYKNLSVSCDSSIKWMKESPGFSIRNITEINTSFSEIGPVEFDHGIVFCSNKEETIIRKKTSNQEPYYDLYFVKRDSLNFKKAESFSSKINTSDHEGPASFTEDGNKIFFTRTKTDQYKADTNTFINRPKLFSAEKKGNGWGESKKFIYNDSLYSFGHGSIEAQEKMFFFASDMPGGFGGTDIYVCFRIDSNWTVPVNLGPFINTSGNELYPFYHQDGSLYFASDTHIGMGGYDLFKADQINGDWAKVTNMKSPINSSLDDISLFISPDKKRGYFSSNRLGGKGKEDIYRFLPNY